MKVSHISIEHNGQMLELDLLVPLSLEAVEIVVNKAKMEIDANRKRFAVYEAKLRLEVSNER